MPAEPSFGLAVNGMIKVTIKIHEAYVQTIVRYSEPHGMTYGEYSTLSASLPRALFSNDPSMMTYTASEAITDPAFKHNEPYLPGFVGYFEMEIAIDEGQTTVEKARYITKERGARDVTQAYQHPELGERMRQNLFDVLAAKDVAKLNEMLGALADAWG